MGSTDYVSYNAVGDEVTRERFASIPVLNFVQALIAACVGYAIAYATGALRSPSPATANPLVPSKGARGTPTAGPPFLAFWRVALTHTIASPVGYSALAWIPYPLLVLVSSCKLVPVMLVSMAINRTVYGARDIASAAIMTTGVLLYSTSSAGEGHGRHAHAGTHADGGGKGGSTAALYTAIGIGLVLLNLSLEGYTNAGQDALLRTHKRMNAWVMMGAMNAWSVLLMGGFLIADFGLRGAGALVPQALQFAGRHPSVLTHIAGFAATGAVAQCFIFLCIEHFGSFVTTTITISRKFATVLLSVALFGHHLAPAQWAGVACVFSGLAMQLAGGGGGGHGRHAKVSAGPERPLSATGATSGGRVIAAVKGGSSGEGGDEAPGDGGSAAQLRRRRSKRD